MFKHRNRCIGPPNSARPSKADDNRKSIFEYSKNRVIYIFISFPYTTTNIRWAELPCLNCLCPEYEGANSNRQHCLLCLCAIGAARAKHFSKFFRPPPFPSEIKLESRELCFLLKIHHQ